MVGGMLGQVLGKPKLEAKETAREIAVGVYAWTDEKWKIIPTSSLSEYFVLKL